MDGGSIDRMNPCTLGWYLPLLVKDVPGALQPSDGGNIFGGSGQNDMHGSREGGGRDDDGHHHLSDVHSHDHQRQHMGRNLLDGPDAVPAKPGEKKQPKAAVAAAGGGWNWKELDAKFRRDLPDEAYVGRLAYRGLVMRSCPGIRMLDGVEVSEKERIKAERLLEGMLSGPKKRP